MRVYLTQAKVSQGRKENIVNVYAKFSKFLGIAFDSPRYQREDSLPKIPQDQELLDVINGARSVRHACVLRGLYETGCRGGEWANLTFQDFDFARKIVRLRPEKSSKAREARLSDTLLGMVQACFAKYPNKPFPTPAAIKKHIIRTRTYLAKLHSNPRYFQIHAHTFRHFRACRLYWETKDLLYVKSFLGHRSISSTMKYLQLVDMGGDEQFIVKAVPYSDAQTAISLLEQGFTFSNHMGDVALYKKRK